MVKNFSVSAGAHQREWVPAIIVVDADSIDTSQAWEMVDKFELTYPVQVEAAAPGKVSLTWLIPSLAAGAPTMFELRPAAAKSAGVKITDQPGQAVAIDINGRPFTSYHYAGTQVRPYLYPVIGPGDATVTRHFPMRDDVPGERHDHPHHRSIWVAHGDVNGADNWSEGPEHAWTVHQGFRTLAGGPVYGTLHSDNKWTDKDGNALLNQQTELRFYALPDFLRLLDVTLTFAADYQTVTFGDTKEGGLIAVRVAGTMDGVKGGRITQSTGATGEKETWGKMASWCHYGGPVQAPGGACLAGIGIIDHPANPRYPTYWHVRDYGLMTANPFGHSHYYNDKTRNGALVLEAGQSLVFRYRLIIHDGTAAQEKMTGQFLNFAYPVKADVVASS